MRRSYVIAIIVLSLLFWVGWQTYMIEQESKPIVAQEPGSAPENQDEEKESETSDSKVNDPKDEKLPPQTKEKIIERLSFLKSPIPGATISTKSSHWPKAPRTYRNGFHEGLDYYQGYVSVPIKVGTPVYAAAAGVVIRSDVDYIELSTSERNKLLAKAKAAPITPEEILDQLRGRQVHIDHGNGVITKYIHLDSIIEGIEVGNEVKVGQLIATVGNSGSSDGAKGNKDGAHLELQILIDGIHFWEPITSKESYDVLKAILEK